MPIDPSFWKDGRLEFHAPPGLEWYGNIPPELLDWTQSVDELNGGSSDVFRGRQGGRPELHDLRWRVAEFFAEVGRHEKFADPVEWEKAKQCLLQEIRKVFPDLKLPEEPDLPPSVDVLEWTRDEKVRKAVDLTLDAAPSLLADEILRRAEENWAELAHERVLGYLAEHDEERHKLVVAALPGCREVVLGWNRRGDPRSAVALEPKTLHLQYREFDAKDAQVSYFADIVPSRFVVQRFEDQDGRDWFEWWRQVGSQEAGVAFDPTPLVRCSREELIEAVRSAFRPSSAMLRGLGAWLERLPPAGTVSTRLELKGPTNWAGAVVGWWVPAVFGRSVDGRTDAAGIFASWYRPRSRETALARLQQLLTFATTEKLRAILCYIAGSPIFARLEPHRPLPYLDLVGESGAGKTHTAQAGIAVLWGLGDGHREYVGGDVLHSGFRRADFLSATDLPILVDESSLSRAEREQMRAAANGALTSRGGTDLLHHAYSPKAPVIFTCNASPDDSDSSASERHGDQRRRIRIRLDETDKAAIVGQREEFVQWMRSLQSGPVETEHSETGGAALYLLNDLTNRGEDLSRLRAIIDGAATEQEAVLSIGATLLGLPPVAVDTDDTDQAGEAFLEWLRVQVGRYEEIRKVIRMSEADGPSGAPGRPSTLRTDPIFQRIRPVTKDGEDVNRVEDVHAVYVTASALEEYKVHRRQVGSSSPFHRLSDLASLASLTDQQPSDILGASPTGAWRRPPRGHVTRLNGVPTRTAKIVLPTPSNGQATLEGGEAQAPA